MSSSRQVLAAIGLVTVSACTTEVVEEPGPVFMQPATNVESRFSADFVHLVGGTITFQTVQGTYSANCKNPAGGTFTAGTEWYVPIAAYAGVPNDWSGAAMTGLALELVENGSSSCTLTVHALSYTCASCGGTSYTTAASASGTIALGTSYAGTALTFTPPALTGGQNQDGDPFYANFDISAIAPWSANPTINVLVSNDPTLVTGSITATYAAYNGSTSLSYVAAPDYAVNAGLTTAAVAVDGTQTVTSVSGGISLSYIATPASSAAGCVYTTTAPTQTNAGIATAFASGTACPTSGDQSWATPFHTMFIDASNFVSVGNTLPKIGYIIFQNASNGVSSYEQVTFTFNAAP